MTPRRPLPSDVARLMFRGRGLMIYRVANPRWTGPSLMRSTRLSTWPRVDLVVGAQFTTGPFGWSIIWRRA